MQVSVEPRDIWRMLKSAGVRYVKFTLVDFFGRPRSEMMRINDARGVFVDGMAFDGSSIEYYTTVNRSDMVAVVDSAAIYVEAWRPEKTAMVFMRIVDDGGKPVLVDPRNLLYAVVEKARSRGYEFMFGGETEFFLVKREGSGYAPADPGLYFEGTNTKASVEFMEELAEAFEATFGEPTKVHHEVAPGQYEVNVPASDPVRAADMVVVTKVMVKDLARRHGAIGTFMPKPFWGMNGNGMHIHVSVWRDGRNLFASRGEPTDELLAAVAGLLEHALSNSAFVAPTVNSYKRLVPHHEAPTRIVWGRANRSALVRVPFYRSVINRLEYRHPDPAANPYFAFAAMMLAIMDGLDRRAKPPVETTVVAYDLEGVAETPRHLGDAAKYAREGIVAREFPSEVVSKYLDAKQREFEEYEREVGRWDDTWNRISEWEYAKYLEA